MMPMRMTPRRIGDLLDRIGCLKHPCDLDLLLFFDRHPRAFLIRERLAEYVGYDLTQVEHSLETLITAGLLRIAATREGRLTVIHVLKQRQSSRRSGGGEPEPVATARALEGPHA